MLKQTDPAVLRDRGNLDLILIQYFYGDLELPPKRACIVMLFKTV